MAEGISHQRCSGEDEYDRCQSTPQTANASTTRPAQNTKYFAVPHQKVGWRQTGGVQTCDVRSTERRGAKEASKRGSFPFCDPPKSKKRVSRFTFFIALDREDKGRRCHRSTRIEGYASMSFPPRGWSPANSAPNSVGPPAVKKSEPPPTDEEMKSKVQHMINLQYEAQRQAYPPNSVPVGDPSPVPPAGGFASKQAADMPNISKPTAAVAPKGRSIMNVPYENYAAPGFAQEAANTEGVGQGHMYFPSEFPKQPPQERQPMLPIGDVATTSIPNYGASGGGPLLGKDITVDDAFDDPDYVEPKAHHHHHHHHRRCCCIRCSRFLHHLMTAETLHRSFCYAAIDGILTGSGILAAFQGMGILTLRASMTTRIFVVAFSLAACASDAICMGVGHVWNTYILSTASADERRTERVSFEKNRANAKGKLVDMLLSRGMLKIDAMSIADTLEGYPDIFVSALVGDSEFGLGEDSLSSGGSSGSLLGLNYSQAYNPDEGYPRGSLRGRRSYGQFNEDEHDPEAVGVKAAMGESRAEGVIMMLSFALFSLVPSLNYLWLSIVMNENLGHSGRTSVASVSVSVTSLIMLLLGIWKR